MLHLMEWFSYWNTSKLLLLALLILFSALGSSSETALFSLNRFQLRKIKEKHSAAYQRIKKLLSRPSRLLTLIIILNEIVGISISNLITQSFHHIYPNENEVILVAVISLILTVTINLILCEITPKVIATKISRVVAIVNSKYLILIYKALYPILWASDASISYALRRFKTEGKDHLSKTMSVLSEEDFMLLMEQGHSEGTVEPSEKKLIKNVFDFDDKKVSAAMTSISKAFSISSKEKIDDILPMMLKEKYSRVPVFHKKAKNIVGILFLKDLLDLKFKGVLVEELMVRPIFVPANTKLSILFRKFKENKTQMAIVKENAGATGVITMEDVLESIFGSIEDEGDKAR